MVDPSPSGDACQRATSRSELRIFISYRRGDNPAEAHLLRARLLEQRFAPDKVFIDVEQIAGRNYPQQIEQAIGACDVLLGVVGPQWLEIPDAESRRLDDSRNVARREIEAAMERGVTVIPVLVAEARMPDAEKVPESLQAFVLNQALRVSPDPGGYDRLFARLDEVAREKAQEEFSNVGQQNQSFVGRESLLTRINAELNSRDSGAAIIAIVGLPAMGKTQLALEYAHRHSAEYRIVWSIPAEDRTSCTARFSALSRPLKLAPRPGQDQVGAVRAALEETEGWLLILDNVKDEADVEDVIPRTGGHVLLTSQRARWNVLDAVIVQVDVLTEDEAVALLQKRAPRGSESDLRRLAEALMRIPLALEQASAAMKSSRMSVEAYLDRLRDSAPELLRRGAPPDYEKTLIKTWRIALDDMEQAAGHRAPGALELLSLCAFLAPDNIPLRAFEKHANVLPEPVTTTVAKPLARTDAVALLADYSHLRWQDDGTVTADSVSLHRSVQYFVRERLDEAGRLKWGTAAVDVVLAAFPEDPSDVSNWESCEVLLPHAQTALQRGAELGLPPLNRARLFDRLGVFQQSRAQFSEADDAFKAALEMLDVADREQRATAATIGTHLGGLLAELGDFDAAYEHHRHALAVHEEICGEESREAAEDRLNLGMVLIERDDLAAAGDQLKKALQARINLYGPNDPAVIGCLNSLIALSFRLGNLLDARRYLQRVLAARAALGQRDHPEAVWFRFLEDHLFGDQAEQTAFSRLDEVITVAERAYSEDHPELAAIRQWLADDFLQAADIDHAEENYRRALEIDERAYGADHWKVARDLLRVFLVLAVRDRTDDARQVLIRAVSVLQRARIVFAGRSPSRRHDVSTFVLAKFDEALDSLAIIYAAVGPFDRICAIIGDTFGRDSLLYGSALEHLGVELHESGHSEYVESSLRVLNDARLIFENHYGGGHRRVARCLRNYAAAQSRRGDIEGATRSCAAALAILDSDDRSNQIELMDVLTTFYPVLIRRQERAGMRAAELATKRAPEAEAVEHPEPPRYTASGILERALHLATSSVGIGPLMRFATALSAAAQFEHALEPHELVVSMLRDAYGDDRPIVADWLDRKGSVLVELGRFDAAIDSYDEALAIHRSHFGPDHQLVAEDLYRRSLALARLGDAAGAANSLELSLAILQRSEPADAKLISDIKLGRWMSVGDAAGALDTAERLYELGYARTRETPGAGEFRARLGCIAALRGDQQGALAHFRACASQHVGDGGQDPVWTVVRGASPAAHRAADRKRLLAALSTLRKDPSMSQYLREFQPQLTAVMPGDWRAKESITLIAPDGQANVISSSEPLDPTMDSNQYAETQGNLLRRDFPDYEEIEMEEIDIYGDRRGFIRHFEWTPPDGVRVSQIQLYYAEDGRGYTATATTPTSNFGRVEVELRHLLSGLRIAP